MAEINNPLDSVLHENSCAATCPFNRRCQDKAIGETLPAECKKEHEKLAGEVKGLANAGVVFDSMGASQSLGLTVWAKVDDKEGLTAVVLQDGERKRYEI